MIYDSYNINFHLSACVAIKSGVKPRTNDQDPLTKKGFYSCWIIIGKVLMLAYILPTVLAKEGKSNNKMTVCRKIQNYYLYVHHGLNITTFMYC